MPVTAYLTLKGQKQGNINGPVTIHGRENSIRIETFSQGIQSPRDPASGLPTGKLTHEPITIVKDVDRSSPLLWNALVNNETLTVWQLKFWQTASDNTERLIYTIELVNSSVASMSEYLVEDPASAIASNLREQLTFTFQKVTWTWSDPTLVAQNDWETPRP